MFVEDRLFATLDTKTHVCALNDHHKVLLSDTVGFIRHLPHHLVASFHATLEEVCQADLLLHVVDVSAPDMWQQVEAVNSVLGKLGAHERPTLNVLNKADRLEDKEETMAAMQGSPLFHSRFEDFVVISALHGTGIEELKEHIARRVEETEVEALVRTHAGNGKLLAFLARAGRVQGAEYADEQATVRVLMDPRRLAKVKGMGGDYVILPKKTGKQEKPA